MALKRYIGRVSSITKEWWLDKSLDIQKLYVIFLFLVSFASFSFFNYYNLYSFHTELLPVDVVDILASIELMGYNEKRDPRVIDTLQKIYMENREIYSKTYDSQTIVVLPQVKLSRNYLEIELVEGFFNISSAKKEHLGDVIFSSSYKKDLNFKLTNFEAQGIKSFIDHHMRPLYRSGRYLDNFDKFDKFRFILHLSNLNIMMLSVTILGLLIVFTYLTAYLHLVLIRMIISLLFLMFFAIVTFQCFNFAILCSMNSCYHNSKFTKNLVICCCQIVLSLILSYRLYTYTMDIVIDSEESSKDSFLKQMESEDFPRFAPPPHKNTPNFVEEFSSEASSVYPQSIINRGRSRSVHEVGNIPYSGSIRHPLLKLSNHRLLESRRNLTAPLPYISRSPESDSTGFDQIKSNLGNEYPTSPHSNTSQHLHNPVGSIVLESDKDLLKIECCSTENVDSEKDNGELKLSRVLANHD